MSGEISRSIEFKKIGLFYACVIIYVSWPKATGSWDHTVKVWHLSGDDEVMTLTGHQGNVSCLCFSITGMLVSLNFPKISKTQLTLKCVLGRQGWGKYVISSGRGGLSTNKMLKISSLLCYETCLCSPYTYSHKDWTFFDNFTQSNYKCYGMHMCISFMCIGKRQKGREKKAKFDIISHGYFCNCNNFLGEMEDLLEKFQGCQYFCLWL